MVVAFAFTLLIVALVFGWTWQRQRRTGYRSWYYDRWKRVDRDRRRRILRAVRRGEAVDDPRDAALALEFIDHQQLTRDRAHGGGWTSRLHYVLLALLAISVGLTTPDFKLIGYVPQVKADGKVSAAAPLPAGAGHFHGFLVTRSTAAASSRPGAVVLRGTIPAGAAG